MNNAQTISIKEMREQISNLVEQVAIAKKKFIITKFGKPKAMVVPLQKTTKRLKGLKLSFGAWKDRKDIKDSAKWVAALRRKMSTRYGKIFS